MDNLDVNIKEYLEWDKNLPPAPEDAVNKAKRLMASPSFNCPHCGKPITPFKKPIKRQAFLNILWLCLGVGAFLLSFVFPRYFFQYLVVALLFGIKWVIDQKSAKTQILIYKALKEEDSSGRLKDLHRTETHL